MATFEETKAAFDKAMKDNNDRYLAWNGLGYFLSLTLSEIESAQEHPEKRTEWMEKARLDFESAQKERKNLPAEAQTVNQAMQSVATVLRQEFSAAAFETASKDLMAMNHDKDKLGELEHDLVGFEQGLARKDKALAEGLLALAKVQFNLLSESARTLATPLLGLAERLLAAI
ncbi:hypothetical protein [Chromobacterium sp. CV08]|uniref:hypothetical protein n=1 Tax=Chromobacterium sp. CV08 TaxID=3133274 RepID=UPI003DA85EE8